MILKKQSTSIENSSRAILRGLNLDKTYFYLHVLPTSADGATNRTVTAGQVAVTGGEWATGQRLRTSIVVLTLRWIRHVFTQYTL